MSRPSQQGGPWRGSDQVVVGVLPLVPSWRRAFLAVPLLVCLVPGLLLAAAPPVPGGLVAPGKDVRTDLDGDSLPKDALARMGSLRLRHPDGARQVQFSRDGRSLISCGPDWIVRGWDVKTGKLLWSRDGAAFSPDGGKVAAVTRGRFLSVRIRDANGKELCRLGDRWNWPNIVFSPNGELVASHDLDGFVRLWSAATGRELGRIPTGPAFLLPLLFSPDSRRLAIGKRDGSVHLWSVDPLKELHQIRVHTGSVLALAFSQDGTQLAFACDGRTVRVWGVESGVEQRRFTVLSQSVESLAFGKGNTLASCSKDGVIKVWDVRDGEEKARFTLGQTVTFTVALAPDGKTLAAWGAGGSVTCHLWDLPTKKEKVLFSGHPGWINRLACSPNGRLLVTAAADGTLRLWEVATGKQLGLLDANAGLTDEAGQLQHGLHFTPDGKHVIGAQCTGQICVWDVEGRNRARNFAGGLQRLTCTALSPDGRLLALGGTKDVHLLSVQTGKLLRQLPVPTSVSNVAFSSDGKLLASASDGGRTAEGRPGSLVTLWEVDSGARKGLLTGHSSFVPFLAFSPDGSTLAAVGISEKAVSLWEVRTLKKRGELALGHDNIVRGGYSPDGKLLALGSVDGLLQVFAVASGEQVWSTRETGGAVYSATFARKDTLVSGGGAGVAVVWDLTQARKKAAAQPLTFLPAEAERLWRDLGSPDADVGYRALQSFTRWPEGVAWLAQKGIRPKRGDKGEQARMARLVADLDSEQFEVRKRAAEELQSLGEDAIPALRQALRGTPSAEVRRQCRWLLQAVESKESVREYLRTLRAVEVLEATDTPAARRELQKLAAGDKEWPETEAARSALNRLTRVGQ